MYPEQEMDTTAKGAEMLPKLPDTDGVSDPNYWFALIDEKEGAAFLGFSVRHMQGLRYKGGGPKFLRLSARCVRYRRWDLWKWAGAGRPMPSPSS